MISIKSLFGQFFRHKIQNPYPIRPGRHHSLEICRFFTRLRATSDRIIVVLYIILCGFVFIYFSFVSCIVVWRLPCAVIAKTLYEWTIFCWLWGRGGSRPIQSPMFPWSWPMNGRHRTHVHEVWLVNWRLAQEAHGCVSGPEGGTKTATKNFLKTPVNSLLHLFLKIQ